MNQKLETNQLKTHLNRTTHLNQKTQQAIMPCQKTNTNRPTQNPTQMLQKRPKLSLNLSAKVEYINFYLN